MSRNCQLIQPLAIRFCAFVLAASVGIVAHHVLRSESSPTIVAKPVLIIGVHPAEMLESPTSIYTIYDSEASVRSTGRFFPDSTAFTIHAERAVTEVYNCSRCRHFDSEWLRSSGLNQIRSHQKE